MFKIMMITMWLLTAVLINISYAFEEVPNGYKNTNVYDKQCPYGDAVIIHRDTEKVSSTGCILFDKKNKVWISKDKVKGSWDYKIYDPKKFDIHTIDGQLLIDGENNIYVRTY